MPKTGLISRALCLVTAFLFLVFWLAGCRRYTSVGIDSDSRHGAYVTTHYYRIRWIGDGSLWAGTGQYSFLPGAKYKIMPFDWGGRFFQHPRPIAPRSIWNHIGFWRYRILPGPAPDPDLMPRESWIAIPGWLPVILFVLPFVRKRIRPKAPEQSVEIR